MKATIFEDRHMNENAIEVYRLSLKNDPDYFPNTWFLLGKLEFHRAQYDSAKVHFEKFLSYHETPQELVAKADLLQKSCVFAIRIV